MQTTTTPWNGAWNGHTPDLRGDGSPHIPDSPPHFISRNAHILTPHSPIPPQIGVERPASITATDRNDYVLVEDKRSWPGFQESERLHPGCMIALDEEGLKKLQDATLGVNSVLAMCPPKHWHMSEEELAVSGLGGEAISHELVDDTALLTETSTVAPGGYHLVDQEDANVDGTS